MDRLLVLVCPLLLATGSAGHAEAPGPGVAPTFERDVAPVLASYCNRCHAGDNPRGGLRLDFTTRQNALKDAKTWEKVADALRAGAMPPEGRRRPSPVELDRLNSWVDRVVFRIDCTGPRDPGRVTLRRLNRYEYNNTIRDLLGVDFQPARDFPSDDSGYGFDNIGDVLSLPTILLEKYLAAAETVVDKAFADPDVRRRLLEPPGRPFDRRAVSRHVLRSFAQRAWRRPVGDDELRRLQDLLRLAQENGDGYQEGMKLAFRAVLVSPHFLFRVESDPAPGDPDNVRTLNDFELASRLSYFLWSSMPDDELLRLAREGRLREGEVLTGQVRRMLRDPKARALADSFAVQWLTVRGLDSFTADPKLFPTFGPRLRDDMLMETRLFFGHIVAEDRSILDLLDANYTFVNERLARHYGIEGVSGEEFRKVSHPDDRRGGVLTHASVLAVTSNPTRTSPVKRGKWILENLLGTPPPPPPPDVPELEEQQAELKGTLRQKMEQHRVNPACATCHQRLDPLGFGLENFDAIGAWRTHEGKSRIDASGVLPGGETFDGPAQLRAVLRKRQKEFVRCLTEKLLTYALGRGLERGDRCFVDDIVARVAKNEYRFSGLVLEIVRSDPFQKRRGKRGEE